MFTQLRVACLCLAWTLCCAQASAGEKHSHRDGPIIIAHIAGEGVSSPRIWWGLEKGRTFLYAEARQDGRVTAIDVSRAERPVIVGESIEAESVNLGTTLAVVNEQPPATDRQSPTTAGKNIRFVSLTDPNSPQPISELDGCSSFSVDRVRGLLFVSNAHGIWIVRDPHLIDESVRIWEQLSSAP